MLCGIGIFVHTRLGALRPLAGGAGRRRDRLRRARGGDRRAGARGAGRLAAGLPAHPADRLPRPRARRDRGHLALRRHPRRLGAVPLPPGPAGGRRRAQRRRSPAWGRRWRTSPSSPSPTWRSPAWRSPAFLMSTIRMRLEDPPTAIRPTAPEDAPAQLALRLANREHTGPWDPARDESFYTEAGQRLELDLDQRSWAAGSAYAFADPRHGPRRPAHRPRRAVERRARPVAERDARLLDRQGRARARATPRAPCSWCCASPSSTRACTACSPRSSPATRARCAWPRRPASASRAAPCAT